MPPIPINLDVPITPEKPQGVTPQTTNPFSNPPLTTTTTTAAPPPNSQSAYSPARPGAAAVPAPTPFALPTPTRTTQQEQQNEKVYGGPPPPQPGAAPMPPGQTQGQASNLPPPPKPGEAAKMREASVTAMPAQMGLPSPQQGYGATHSTTPTTGAMGGSQGPTTVNLGPVSSPAADATGGGGGYQQNIYAQELSSAQRASLEEQQRRESNVGRFGGAGDGANSGMLGGDGGGNSSSVGGGGSGDEGMWGAVKGWASGVGSRIAETEEEVWRRINGAGGK